VDSSSASMQVAPGRGGGLPRTRRPHSGSQIHDLRGCGGALPGVSVSASRVTFVAAPTGSYEHHGSACRFAGMNMRGKPYLTNFGVDR
jgi:hypothetical protein